MSIAFNCKMNIIIKVIVNIFNDDVFKWNHIFNFINFAYYSLAMQTTFSGVNILMFIAVSQAYMVCIRRKL